MIRLESLNNIRKFYTFFINKTILFLIRYNNTGGSTMMNDQIYNYLINVLETIYDRKEESKFMQYLFNMDNPHYVTLAIYLCTSSYKHIKVNVNDLKKKLTCSDRQVDIMIQTLLDKKFIYKENDVTDKRVQYIYLMDASCKDVVAWAIHTCKKVSGVDLTMKRAHQV